MKIGMIGLGKLGLPVALSIENKGHEVMGYDINPQVSEYIKNRQIPYQEEGTPELLKNTNIKLGTLEEVVEFADIIFVPIQTPHHEKFEGITRLPDERVDFDYTYLVKGMQSISRACTKDKVVVIISTVLPGTVEKYILPVISKHVKLCYNPFFIAMGTTRADFEYPEFVLLGCDDDEISQYVINFYKTIHDRPVFKTSIKNAELIKVIYNTFISTKIAFINTVMEVCDKTGCNVDVVSDAIALGTDRLISTKYLRGGMGDAGGCHPRDNIALSWLAREKHLSYDWFENIMMARERQTEWLVELIKKACYQYKLDIVLLGSAYKKNINLTIGSAGLLLSNILNEQNIEHTVYDPLVDGNEIELHPAIYFIATNHDTFSKYQFPPGSVVIDPWGMIEDQTNVIVRRLGR